MTRPIQARIDAAAFRHNYLQAKSHAPRSRAWCVVKANAYGHGLLRCAESVRDIADGFALLDMAEAEALRKAGFTQPILLLEGCFDADDWSFASHQQLTAVVHEPGQIETLARAQCPKPVDVYLKINTGMNRLGVLPATADRMLEGLRASGKIRQITLMTHFADADGAGIETQLTCFRSLREAHGLPWSTANSAALLRFPEAHGDWVRPGIMLYGGSPMPETMPAAQVGLQPVMTLTSRIIATQSLQAGDQVGYSGLFIADRAMRVGVVACGYADAYPRHAPSGTPLLVDGQRTRTVGRVSMDMLVCDLSDLPQAEIGSTVTLWGAGMPADEVAASAGTVSYELFCALAARVPVIT